MSILIDPVAIPAAPRRPPILCVDDEPQVLEALKLLLGRTYDVHAAESAAAALQAMEVAPFPVLLCDMRMPVISGAELLASVASRWPTTVGILLSGARSFADSSTEAIPAPAFRFLAKPCNPKVLRETITHAFARHEQLLHSA